MNTQPLGQPLLIMGLGHKVVRQPPLFKTHLPALYWWHDRGRLHWEDPTTNGYDSISQDEAIERHAALGLMLRNGERDVNKIYPDECRAMRTFLDEFRELIRLAEEHGDIDSPGMREELKRRRAKSVSVPACISPDLSDLRI